MIVETEHRLCARGAYRSLALDPTGGDRGALSKRVVLPASTMRSARTQARAMSGPSLAHKLEQTIKIALAGRVGSRTSTSSRRPRCLAALTKQVEHTCSNALRVRSCARAVGVQLAWMSQRHIPHPSRTRSSPRRDATASCRKS
jgi:hypothetical protein